MMKNVLKQLWPKSALSGNQIAWVCLFSAAFTLGVIFFAESELGKAFQYNIATNIEFKVKDSLSKTPKLHEKIKILSLGDQSVALMNRNQLFLHEWAHILEEIAAQQPSKIIIDKIFGVANLSRQAKQVGIEKISRIETPIITGAFLSPGKIPKRVPIEFSSLLKAMEERLGIGLRHLNPQLFDEGKALDGVNYLKSDPTSVAYARHDSLKDIFNVNGLFNYGGQLKYNPFVRVGDGFIFPHASMLAADKIEVNDRGKIIVDGHPLPINDDGMSIINMVNKQDFYGRIKPLINIKQFPDIVEEGDIVLILPNMYTGSTDFHSSPMGYVPGGFFIASVINSIITGRWIDQLKFPSLQIMVCTFFGLFLALFLSTSIFWISLLIFLLIILVGGVATFVYLDLETAWWWGSLCFLTVSIAVFTYKSIFFEKFKEINDEITDILDSIEQAIFTFNPDLSLNSEYSKKAGVLFDESCFREKTPIAKVFSLDEKKTEEFSQWVKLLYKQKTMKKWPKLVLLSPLRRMTVKLDSVERTIDLDYKPILRNNVLTKIMVLGTDITSKLEIESKLEFQQRENSLRTERMQPFVNHDLELIEEFIKQSWTLVDQYSGLESIQYLVDHIDVAYRDLHTLKGNAGSFGFVNLAKIADRAEDFMSKIRDSKNEANMSANLSLEVWSEQVGHLRQELNAIDHIRETLFKGFRGKVSVDRKLYDNLLVRAQNKQLSSDSVFQELQKLTFIRFEQLMEKYSQLIRDYSQKSGKELADLIIHNPEQLIDKKRFALFDKALIHLVRNAMDHGIEDPDDRALANKNAGCIEVSFVSDLDKEEICVRDDGRGIDPEVIYQKALEKNLCSPDKQYSKEEKINFICQPGFSTKEEANEISGRGVGMDAVNQLLQAQGGGLFIESEKGKGTSIHIYMPKEKELKAS